MKTKPKLDPVTLIEYGWRWNLPIRLTPTSPWLQTVALVRIGRSHHLEAGALQPRSTASSVSHSVFFGHIEFFEDVEDLLARTGAVAVMCTSKSFHLFLRNGFCFITYRGIAHCRLNTHISYPISCYSERVTARNSKYFSAELPGALAPRTIRATDAVFSAVC